MSTCECSPCGREFTTLAAFDRHQDVDYSRRPVIICLDPATVGLERNALGRWHFPADARSRARVAALSAERASARTSVAPRVPGPSETLTEPRPQGES